ncbi:MAG: DUF3187 family protein [Nitrospinota bacterium]
MVRQRKAAGRLRVWAVVLAGVLLAAAPSGASAGAGVMDPREILGPLPLRNLQPIHLLFFEFTPERAYALRKGNLLVRLDITETNTLLVDLGKEPSFKADMEMSRFAWRFLYGVTERLTLGLNLPLVFTHGPFLDQTIEATERGFGKLRGDRGAEISDQVSVTLVSAGITEIGISEGSFGIGDVSLEGKYQFLRETFWVPAASLRVAVKFPTGDFDKLHGSGKFDGAFGLAIQKIWGLWSASLGGGVTIPGNPFTSSDLDPDPFLYAHLSLERLITAHWSAVAQIKWVGGLMDIEVSPAVIVPDPEDVRPLTDRIVEVHLGAKWAFARNWLAQFAVVEDIADSAAVGADFSFLVSLGARFAVK